MASADDVLKTSLSRKTLSLFEIEEMCCFACSRTFSNDSSLCGESLDSSVFVATNAIFGRMFAIAVVWHTRLM